MKLTNKTIIITGASDGIGQQIAFKLAEHKTKLLLIARDNKRLEATKAKCLDLGASSVEAYECDLKSISEIKKTIAKMKASHKSIDILINNAGIWHTPRPLETISSEEIEAVIATNLTGLIHMTSLVLPGLKKSKEAAIINVSSRSGFMAQEGQSVYAASKWGVTGFTEVLKIDLKDSNIRVATVHQGGTNTKLFAKTKDTRDTTSFTNPADLADAIVYILTRPKGLWIHDLRVEK